MIKSEKLAFRNLAALLMMAKRKRSIWRILLPLLFLGAVVVATWGYVKYRAFFQTNIQFEGDHRYVFIATGSDLKDVAEYLYDEGVLRDTTSFIWVAEKKNYPNHIYPGKYEIKNGMTNNELVDLLRSGIRVPVQVTFNTVRTKADLAGKVAAYIEADSSEIIALLQSKETAVKYGFHPHTFISMFIPNTYEFHWHTSAETFVQRMAKEYKRFWTDERKQKAKALGMSQSEVATLASIVQAEQSQHRDERAKVAGLYINRLKKGMRLESDPTLVFALGNFNIKRVLNKHKKLDSPYNTYTNRGLPPGPINLPEQSSIDAVLNYEAHSYIFMCAKADFSGYHHFSKNYRQHLVYARQYQKELNRRKILR